MCTNHTSRRPVTAPMGDARSLVRYRDQNGPHLLNMSSSAFDPKRTSRTVLSQTFLRTGAKEKPRDGRGGRSSHSIRNDPHRGSLRPQWGVEAFWFERLKFSLIVAKFHPWQIVSVAPVPHDWEIAPCSDGMLWPPSIRSPHAKGLFVSRLRLPPRQCGDSRGTSRSS